MYHNKKRKKKKDINFTNGAKLLHCDFTGCSYETNQAFKT